MHIAMASDNNYVRHLGVTIYSALENNQQEDSVTIHILDSGIKRKNKICLEEIVNKFDRKIYFYNLKEYEQKLAKGALSANSLSTYSRIFLAQLLDRNIDKVIYMDVGAVIVDSLKDLWGEEIDNYLVAGVIDIVLTLFKLNIGLNKEDKYINAGFLLINLKLWREKNIEEKLLDFIKSNNGKITHYDQGAINAVCKDKIRYLHPKYNITTMFFMMNYERILKLYEVSDYYSRSLVEEAKKNPVFIHYVEAGTTRPWIKGCKHPMANKYINYLRKTPWKNEKLEADNRSLKKKIIEFSINNLPISVFKTITNIVSNLKERNSKEYLLK